MASLGLTLAREATIPIELAEEARSLLDKNPREWAPSLLYETATGEKIKDTERRVSEFRAITDDSELWDACERIVKSLVYLPGGAVEGDDDGKSLFHLDASGATAFSAPEAARASEYLASSRFLDAVKRSLQTKRFELPQQSAAVSAHFCNESVYGNLNVLCVTGVVRLDPNADTGGDDATPVSLDWPSEATRAADKRARKKLLKGPANYAGPWND